MTKIVICDDSKEHNNFLHSIIHRILSEKKLDGYISLIAETTEQIIEYSEKNIGDNIYFLDINLGDTVNGINLGHLIREFDKTSYIVYITAHQEFSLEGYKVKSFDFLIKPPSIADIENILIQIFKDINSIDKTQSFMLKAGSVIHKIPYKDIIFFEKYRNILNVHTEHKIVSGYVNLKDIIPNLPTGFIQCHNAIIISLDNVKEFNIKNNILTMSNKEICSVSRKYKAQILSLLGNI